MLQPQRSTLDVSSVQEWDELIPPVFCWTKMGTEAGQPLESILRRKELERRAGGGLFAWGIGNSLGVAAKLAQQEMRCNEVDVLFTQMRSAAKHIDVAPSTILLWLNCLNEEGRLVRLPSHMVVTSRGNLAQAGRKRAHYALICNSSHDITFAATGGVIDANRARNFASLNPLGASQVTAVVRYQSSREPLPEKSYPVTFRAKLHGAGFVRLASPVVLDGKLAILYRQLCNSVSADEWAEGALQLRQKAGEAKVRQIEQKELFDNATTHRTGTRKRTTTVEASIAI